MKNRSNRLSTSDHHHHHDDWVNGSWTVDCVCGVNFDDGEEMVDCDECGVWVHTRCSRYVKSEKSFACHKCKNNNNNTTTTTSATRNNDSEETEVAQLLVELPTKTLRMDHNNNPPPYTALGPPRHPSSRFWTDIPLQDRVHVQGIPGGDPSLFAGLSSVFTPELWKCTGFVPKKFNFHYREFPCWDEPREVDAIMGVECENPVDKGAGVLFSLSNENALASPVPNLVALKTQVDRGCNDKVAPLKDVNKSEGRKSIDARPSQSGLKKDRSLLRPSAAPSGKRKKDDLGTSKDQTRKKSRVLVKGGDSKKKASTSRAASTLSSDAKRSEYNEDRRPKGFKTDNQTMRAGNGRNSVAGDHLADGNGVVDNNVDKAQKNLALRDQTSEALFSDLSKYNISVGARPEEDRVVHQLSARFESSSKTDDGVAFSEDDDSGSVPKKEKVVYVALDKSDDGGGSSRSLGVDSYNKETLIEDVAAAEPEDEGNRNIQDTNDDMLQPHGRIKSEMDIDGSEGVFDIESSPPTDVKVNEMKPSVRHLGISGTQLSGKTEDVDEVAIATNSQSSEPKVQDIERNTEPISGSPTERTDEMPRSFKPKGQLAGLEGSKSVRKTSLELKHGSRRMEEPSKSGGLASVPPAPPSQRKVLVSVGKSSTTATTNSKPAMSDNSRPVKVPNFNPTAKERGISDGRFSSKKDTASTDIVRDEDGRKIPKEHLKSSVVKISHSTKTSHASVSKRTPSDSKDPVLYSSSRAYSVQNVALTSGFGEPPNSSQTQCASLAQNKITVPGLPQKGEKGTQSSSQPLSKVNNAPTMPPASLNSTAALSDEELALLLHQELNSSPRVPRVPRMRQAGSLPQLASPTATSMLMKRSSNSGGRDQSSVSRRKNRDLAKDGSHGSRELDDEAKKIDRVHTSPDRRKHDSSCTTDPTTTKRESENGHAKGLHPIIKKSIPHVPTVAASSGLSSSTNANEQNLPFKHNSPQNASDDDTSTIRRPAHLTLPGLIAEIMSKGERMTYEELCNAVLPHWPHLRKHNGERYAYSSHSQAVLDCLRNRHEWARLVDRGPKTNASRKRRKHDAEHPSFETEENEDGGKEVEESKSMTSSQREEFPKGKRKARKRRWLALRGRGVKDVRRRRMRRKEAVLSDDDDLASFSSSSSSEEEEESLFSEDDEIEGGGGGGGGGGTGQVSGEASTSSSSDETATRQ